jgi:cytochrome P450
MVLVDAYGVHHDPEIYPRPEEFRPERFLEAPSDGYAFLPFGGGAHRCLGASLAMLEMKVVFRELLDRFELEPTTAGLAKPVARGPTIAPRGGGRVRVKRGAASADAPSDAATPALA